MEIVLPDKNSNRFQLLYQELQEKLNFPPPTQNVIHEILTFCQSTYCYMHEISLQHQQTGKISQNIITRCNFQNIGMELFKRVLRNVLYVEVTEETDKQLANVFTKEFLENVELLIRDELCFQQNFQLETSISTFDHTFTNTALLSPQSDPPLTSPFTSLNPLENASEPLNPQYESYLHL